MPTISVQHIRDDFLTAVDGLLAPFMSEISISGKSILIKPNLVEPLSYTTGQTTNPALVDAVVTWCKNMGANRIAIGEGPSYFQPASALRECFFRTGMADVARRQQVPWILFDEGSFKTFRHYSPETPARFSISEHAFIWDHVINIPVPKTHYLTRVSIAMKNLKGFIKREEKPSFHHCGSAGIDGSVSSLNMIIRPSLNIVDCTAPIHRNKSCILAGSDIVAVDAVTTALMGMNPQSIGTIQMGYKKGLGEMEVSKTDIMGDELKTLKMNVEQPEQYLKMNFPTLNIEGQKACSGCLIPLFSSLHRIKKEEKKPASNVTIILGKVDSLTEKKNAVLIGQCTKKYKHQGLWCQGCPPEKEEIYNFLMNSIME